MNKPRLWTKNFIGISIANFLVFITFYYLLVTLPIYALQDLNGNAIEAGLITTTFLIAAILSRPFAGRWIEKVGKFPILMSALLTLCLASALYFFPHSMTAMLILRFCHGIGFGMATTAIGTIVADLIPDSRKGEGMGYYGLTINLGMVIGPFLGLTVMQQLGTNVMFTVNAICAVLAIMAGLLIRLPKKSIATKMAMEPKRTGGIKSLFEMSAIPISLVAAFFGLVYSSIISFVSIYAKEIGLVEAASYFFIVYAVVLLLSRPFTGKWFDQYGANVIIYPSILCFAIGTYLLSVSSSAFMFLLSAALIGLGWGTAFPSLQTIAIQLAPPKKRALATATYLSIFDFGFGVGSLIFGMVVTGIGHSALYFYSTFLVLIGLAVYYFLHGRNNLPLKNKVQEDQVAS
ncbi:MFS family permease [Bacillus pakistanensis]|uniref:MFS family permease n=1 Tax=Rossellomorea pakistanensis TaxID=992288 RepID=A0ABS2N6M4_9BACI|nr:MFS transporter [Bacillus pakistanensis]MBM7583469.1 MFS family permease [Bacillus pakistanensis]